MKEKIGSSSEPGKNESEISNKNVVNWIRKQVTRRDVRKNEFFFHEEEKLSIKIVDRHEKHKENNLKFSSYLFNFIPTDAYSGIIRGNNESRSKIYRSNN